MLVLVLVIHCIRINVFSLRQVRSNGFILRKTPRCVRQIMTEIPMIGNEDIKSILIRSPRLLHQQADTIHEKLNVLRAFKIPDDSISRIPIILNISSKTITRGIQEFKTMRELAGHWKNPRMLLMIYYWEGVKRNLTKLKELNIRFTSIHVLCAGNKAFQKYVPPHHSYRLFHSQSLNYLFQVHRYGK